MLETSILSQKQKSKSRVLKKMLQENKLIQNTVPQWGYKKDNKIRTEPLEVMCRPNTTDNKVIEEVLIYNAYQNKGSIQFIIEPTDVWLDLGGNIGTFALLALSYGASVVSVEPEPENFMLLETNVMMNFPKKNKINLCPVGVAPSKGTMNLYLCNGDYNKYRHSMCLTKKRKHIKVPVVALSQLWKLTVQNKPINAIKMDIEGMEIELLEKFGDKMQHIQKLVFEYTFDADPSIARFLSIIDILKKSFKQIRWR